MLGTIDEASDIRRNTPDAIRAYFVHFLGGHEEVTPKFPDFDAEDVTRTPQPARTERDGRRGEKAAEVS